MDHSKIIISKEMEGIPTEFQIFPHGQLELEGQGTVCCDDESMSSIISNFQRRGNDLVIDYEHQTLKDTQAPAAGWIKRLVNKGSQGLWAVVEWTTKAREYLSAKEYRYFSPVFMVRKSDSRVASLHSVALTNTPKINMLKPIVASMPHDAFTGHFDEVTIAVAKIFGNTSDELERYASKDSGDSVSADDLEKINWLLGQR